MSSMSKKLEKKNRGEKRKRATENGSSKSRVTSSLMKSKQKFASNKIDTSPSITNNVALVNKVHNYMHYL